MRDLPRRLLAGPGPSGVPDRVLEAMSRPLIGHLDPVFLGLLDEISEMLRAVFRTRNPLTFAVSGTGSAGMECALANVVEPGDRVAIGVAGLFGERMCDVAARLGAEVERVEAPWGEPVDPGAVAETLRAGPVKACAIVHAETSCGMLQPLDEIARACRTEGVALVVDAVTSLGGAPVDVDGWTAAACYSGTQKCLAVPPGLAPITFAPPVAESLRGRREPVRSWYLDAGLIAAYLGVERVYHHTAPVSMLYGLHEGLRIVLEEGLQARLERHARVGERLMAGLEALGFSPVAREGCRIPHLAAVFVPEAVDERAARRRLLDEFGIEVGGGLGPLAGRAWRIGVMGEACDDEVVERILLAVESSLG